MPFNLIRLPEVIRRTCKGRTSVYDDMTAGIFPKPVKVGRRAVAWPDHEVDALIAARVSGASENQLRTLVQRLAADRAALACA
ncbi:MAG: hypothetical protein OJF60_002184 [Burkholderiaceae bacterium]|jgi:prophage regulatory protein|nr:MAG: hypothetical protein OJF60_002184 [Burkholderiaceae bacterium]